MSRYPQREAHRTSRWAEQMNEPRYATPRSAAAAAAAVVRQEQENDQGRRRDGRATQVRSQRQDVTAEARNQQHNNANANNLVPPIAINFDPVAAQVGDQNDNNSIVVDELEEADAYNGDANAEAEDDDALEENFVDAVAQKEVVQGEPHWINKFLSYTFVCMIGNAYAVITTVSSSYKSLARLL